MVRASALAIASLKRCTVAEIPQTIGTGGMSLAPLMSRCTMVAFSARSRWFGSFIPRWASSRMRCSVRCSSAMVLASVSHIVNARASGIGSRSRGALTGESSGTPLTKSDFFPSFWRLRK